MLEFRHLFHSLLPLAQIVSDEGRTGLLGYHLMAVALFSCAGIIVLGICLLLIEKLTPYSVSKEIVDEHNTALAIVIGAIVLGISMIIAASILG
jgi:putative membrane protein